MNFKFQNSSQSQSESEFRKLTKMSKYCFSIVRETTRVSDISQDLELLAKDGKIRANQSFLQVASPIINKAILENDSKVFDLKNYSQEAVIGLLEMIYSGQLTVTGAEVMDEVMRLAQDLEINFQLATLESENFKVEAPKIPEEPQENDNDPGLIKMDDGRFGCGICFKSFSSKTHGTTHYREQHLSEKSQRNFKCRAPNCDKTFAFERYMKNHMRQRHGISSKMLKSTKSVKVPKVPKKGMKHESMEQNRTEFYDIYA